MKSANENKEITFISMFSGIEAASVAFGPLGWKAICFAEIEKFPSAVLAYHYPDVPNVGDMSKHDWSQYRGMVDVVCGGPPCQAFSVAGFRNSMSDARGNLSLVYMRALHAIKPRNAIVENVPGWLNTPDNAFGCFLAGLVGADDPLRSPDGTKWPNAGMVAGPLGRAAWRIQDAQYHGIPQRRRRVLVVADFGNGADPAAVLFERAGMHGNSPPRREAGKDVAAFSASSLGSYRQSEVSGADRAAGGDNGGGSENLVAFAPEIARCDATREGSSQDYESTTMVAVSVTGEIAHTLKAEGADASEDGTGRGTPIVAQSVTIRGRDGGATAELGGDVATALRASQGGGDKPHVLVFDTYNQDAAEVTHTLRRGSGDGVAMPAVLTSAVRRLTPRECERLQGFPDGYTRIPLRAYAARKVTRTRPADMWEFIDGRWWLMSADGPRYKALGNSWAVPKFVWLGKRLARLMPANDNAPTTAAA